MTKKISPPVLTGLRESEANFSVLAGDDIGGLQFERQEIDGVEREHLHLNNCVFSHTAFRECRFVSSHFNDVLFEHCDLRNATLTALKPETPCFEACTLQEAELHRTSLKGIDLRDCEIAGMQAQPGDLRGATVTSLQAADLSRMLGVIVKE